jgi:ubiquinone/menaquinone biosynthesis C-methylase UbiE
MTEPPNLRPDAFAGTAAAYARFRPPYPTTLLQDLLARAGVAPHGLLLDLACGPGRVALDLAAAFESVWAIDLEPEMVAVGQQAAAHRGIDNVSWFVGRAEDLAAPAGAFDLITIGEAFHRLDQSLVARQALGWLKPGGCLAMLGAEGILDGREAWQVTVAEVARRWMARAFPGGWAVARPGAEVGPGSQARVLQAAGFIEVTQHTFEEPRDWSFAEIIGYLESTSVCSRKALGGDFEAFEAELRSALPAESPTFHETSSWGYTLGRRPR